MDASEEDLQLESIRRGFAEIEAGHFIPHEEMKAWLLSLGLQHVLPLPKCVCGARHESPSQNDRRNGRAGL